MTGRLIWVDWLKAIVVLGVVAYHAAQPFIFTEWLVSDDEQSLLLSALAGIGYLFAMPLMFLLAGSTSMLALRRRSVRQYLSVRLLRLGVPLVVGLLLLSPFEAWIGHLSSGGTQPLAAFSVDYLAAAEITFSPVWLGEVGHHLWFLGFLLGYVVVSLPLLVWLRDRPVPELARAPALVILGPPIVLSLVQWPLRAAFPEYRDWADAALWFAYYAAGVAIVLDRGLVTLVGRVGLWMLLPAVVLLVGLGWAALSTDILRLEGNAALDLPGLAYAAARTTVGWCLVLASLALGIRWLDRGERAGARAGEASLAFYVLHHPIVLLVAAVVVTTELGMWPKFLLIFLASLAITGAVYELLIRRVAPLRAVFGVAPPNEEVGNVGTLPVESAGGGVAG